MDEQIQGILNLINQDPNGWAILSRGNAHLDQLESLIEQPVLRYGGKSFWDEKETSDVLHLMAFFRQSNDVRLMKRVLALFGENEEVLDQTAFSMKGRKVTFGELSIPDASSPKQEHFTQTSPGLHRRLGIKLKSKSASQI